MSVQYLSDRNGHITAVQVPIEEWEQMKTRYPDIDDSSIGLQPWQMQLIDNRLVDIEKNPNILLPIDRLLEELDDDV